MLSREYKLYIELLSYIFIKDMNADIIISNEIQMSLQQKSMIEYIHTICVETNIKNIYAVLFVNGHIKQQTMVCWLACVWAHIKHWSTHHVFGPTGIIYMLFHFILNHTKALINHVCFYLSDQIHGMFLFVYLWFHIAD